MNKLIAILTILLLPVTATAYDGLEINKPLTIGIATYKSVISFDNPYYYTEDDELSGFALSLGYAMSDQFALRGTYFFLEHDDFSDIESSGFDLLGYIGVGLASPGLKAYVGGGLFRDEWELGSFDKTFDGLQLNGGVGYNWDAVALEFVLGLRDASDYEDFVNEIFATGFDATAVTYSLMLSVRL